MKPLAERLRPRVKEDLIGHTQALSTGKHLSNALSNGELSSMILWGPPGCGKTTLAHIMSQKAGVPFISLSAVTASIKDIKELMAQAKTTFEESQVPTLLFIDEIHRFNRSQQDAFLPFVESGEIILVGTTTENPSFELNAALLSRVHVIQLQALSEDDLLAILKRALHLDEELAALKDLMTDDILQRLSAQSEGDARRALNQLEGLAAAVKHIKREPGPLSLDEVNRLLAKSLPRYDKSRDHHYDFISALHKSLRNSDVQASLYWLARMIEGGENPLFIARRLVRFASEDIGLADPQALRTALDAQQAVDFIGLPEGALALAQAVVWLASAPKSNALYTAWKSLEKTLESGQRYGVPLSIRNAPTKLMSELGYGEGYQYAHDTPSKTTSLECLPRELSGKVFYHPGNLGTEKTIAARIQYWEKLRQEKQP